VLPAAVDTAAIMFESHAKEFRKFPLCGKRYIRYFRRTLWSIYWSILYSTFYLQVDEVTNAVKGAHLKLVLYVLLSDIKERYFVLKTCWWTAMSFEVFNTIDHFLEENEINLENCTGFCTDWTIKCLDEIQDFKHR